MSRDNGLVRISLNHYDRTEFISANNFDEWNVTNGTCRKDVPILRIQTVVCRTRPRSRRLARSSKLSILVALFLSNTFLDQ